jgi:hypothetical protein
MATREDNEECLRAASRHRHRNSGPLHPKQWIDVGAGGADAASAKVVEAAQRLVAHRSSANPDHDADIAKAAAAVFSESPARDLTEIHQNIRMALLPWCQVLPGLALDVRSPECFAGT